MKLSKIHFAYIIDLFVGYAILENNLIPKLNSLMEKLDMDFSNFDTIKAKKYIASKYNIHL